MILTTELIGLQTLKKWIISNEFGLNATTKVMELKKAVVIREKMMDLIDKKEKITFDDIEPYVS